MSTPYNSNSASGRWSELDGVRQTFLTRCEHYAQFTIPKLLIPTGQNQETYELQHDYQSVGAQAVNFLSNKIMLALFAPSRPFFKLEIEKKDLDAMKTSLEISDEDIQELLATGERDAISKLDQLAIRPKLHEALKHLIVLGNVLLYLGKNGAVRVISLRDYVVQRNTEGKVIEILVRDSVKVCELNAKIRATLDPTTPYDRNVTLYQWIKLDEVKKKYVLDQWVDETKLADSFSGEYPEDKLPYRALTWDLADKAHYGTGLVEDYAGDFSALSVLSQSTVEAAVLASEFRWLLNPSSTTRPEDFSRTRNGGVLPGVPGDLALIASQKSSDLQIVQSVGADYIQRIGRGFLLNSAVTRNAERVTAEEIRQQANELESSLGGAYSRLAIDFQNPLAFWLLDTVEIDLKGTSVTPVIITGLDALSRNGDLDNLKMFLADVTGIQTLPEQVLMILKLQPIISMLASARGIQSSKYIKSEAEVQAEMQQQALMQAMLQGGMPQQEQLDQEGM